MHQPVLGELIGASHSAYWHCVCYKLLYSIIIITLFVGDSFKLVYLRKCWYMY